MILIGWFLLLTVAVCFFWQKRFERAGDSPACHLGELLRDAQLPEGATWEGPPLHPVLRLRASPGQPATVVRLALPIRSPVDFLHIRFRAYADNLIPGREFWEDGRCLIEWHDPEAISKWDNDPFFSGQYYKSSGLTELVMKPEKPPAIPVLRVENIGASGDLRLEAFEASVLKERPLWKMIRWFLVAGWLAWAVAWIRAAQQVSLIRSLAAAAVWVLMAIYFVLPGPWSDVRSLGRSFELGPEILAPTPPITSQNMTGPHLSGPALNPSETVPSVGKVPPRGDFALRIKLYVQHARPLLHVLLLFVPTFIMVWWVGARPATSLAIILSLTIEAAQLAFGFGFDWIDVFDLASDGLGILLGLWLCQRLKKCEWVPRRFAAYA
jgi:hypothetical protein